MIDLMRWTPRQLAGCTGGEVTDDGGGEAECSPVEIDSRRCGPGSVFVPLVADRDGHGFVAAALAAGARAYLYEPGRRPEYPSAGAAAVAVADTAGALLDIGRAARGRLACPVVGITGSVGKTSTKDLAAAALGGARRVAASERSFNNEFGVPLTLANAAEDTEVAIIEMGARGRGHIALLCSVARPTIAVVTAVAAVHTELFGTVEDVALAKGELVEALPAEGTAVLNADDHRVAAMARRTSAEVLRYGLTGSADVAAEDVTIGEDLRPRFLLRSPWGAARVQLAVRGHHQIGNALAALTVALRLGVPVDEAAAAVGRGALSPWRMELATSPGGATILNDAYNANPTSMAAALRSLRHLTARRRVAVVGEMAELGERAAQDHLAIAALAAELGIELVAVGTPAYGVEPLAGIDEAVEVLGPLGEGDAVLVKASRVAGLERLAQRLLGVTG